MGGGRMLEIPGIHVVQDENYTDIVYNLCQMTFTVLKNLRLKYYTEQKMVT